jgi:hypothetical protein
MFKNYLKITLRNIMKHKGYSFINIFGLAIGMACCWGLPYLPVGWPEVIRRFSCPLSNRLKY